MNNKSKNGLKKLISTISILTIIISFTITSQAESVKIIENDKNALITQNDSSWNTDAIVNLISNIINQQTEDIFADKPYSDEYLNWLNLSKEEKQEYGTAIPNKEFIAIHSNEDKNNNLNENNKNANLADEKIDIATKNISVKSSKTARSKRKLTSSYRR